MSNPRTNRTRSTAKPTSSRGTMARSRNRKQEERDSIIEEMKKAKKRLVKKPVTTGGKNPRSLNYQTGPSASKRATPEGGRAGFMAGMTGGQDKKKTPTTKRPPIDFRGAFGNNKTATTDKPKRSFMSSGARSTTTGTKTVDNKVNYSEATKPKKRATTKVNNKVNYSEATKPKKGTTTKVDNKVNYSEATKPKKGTKKSAMPSDFSRVLPKGSEDLIKDKKVDSKKDTDKKKTTNKKAEPKKKSFRERRLDRMGERLASAKSEGRKRRIKRRMERVKGRIADDEKKPKKKMYGGGMMKAKGKANGGMMKAKGMKAGGKFSDLTGDGKVTRKDILKGRGVPGMKGGGMKTKGSMAGGKMKTKGYSAGGVKKAKAKKLRGAGIERRGYRPAKMR